MHGAALTASEIRLTCSKEEGQVALHPGQAIESSQESQRWLGIFWALLHLLHKALHAAFSSEHPSESCESRDWQFKAVSGADSARNDSARDKAVHEACLPRMTLCSGRPSQDRQQDQGCPHMHPWLRLLQPSCPEMLLPCPPEPWRCLSQPSACPAAGAGLTLLPHCLPEHSRLITACRTTNRMQKETCSPLGIARGLLGCWGLTRRRPAGQAPGASAAAWQLCPAAPWLPAHTCLVIMVTHQVWCRPPGMVSHLESATFCRSSVDMCSVKAH